LTDGTLFRGLCRDAGKSTWSFYLNSKLTLSSLVEYATREQAQQAVNTLSNQNLMGRLVYVREVWTTAKAKSTTTLTFQNRTVRPNLDSQVRQQAAEAVTKVVPDAAVSEVDLEVAWVPAVVLEAAVKSTSPTFVSFQFLCKLVLGSLLTLTSSFPTL
jgi:hypothetical protein